jgi:hypothetical protein
MSMKKVRGVVALIGTALLTLVALPAQAFTPTLSEVLYLPGVDPSGDFDDLALSADATTALVISDGSAWVVNVTADSATEITGLDNPDRSILDGTATYGYITGGNDQVFKVNMATAAVVATWDDPALTFYGGDLYWSADGAHIYMVGGEGVYPNWQVAVAKITVATGAISQYTWSDLGYMPRQAAFDSEAGKIMIPYRDTATGLDVGLVMFNTTSNTFTDAPWVGDGQPIACDSRSGVVGCVVDDTNDYIATINDSGAIVETLTLDSEVSDADTVGLTHDGALAYAYGSNGGLSNVEAVDLGSMTSVDIFNLSTEYTNQIRLAPDARQIWFTADYNADYDGGYQVVQYADPNAGSGGSGEELAPTGGNALIAGALAALSALALTAGLLTRRSTRRHGA